MAEVTEPAGEATRVGQIVGDRYQIIGLLGEGGMGVVYEARHTFVGRRFAIKFLRPEYARELDMLARFQREARAAGALESENIAAVTDFGLDALGAPYIVMEHLAGDDLGRLLARNGRLAATRAAGLMLQACRGLAVAHAAGIVHRDLKPGNLFVLRRADGGDLLKVIDFGIAKLRSAAGDDPSKTRTGATMGTPYYMPPEQARGQRDIDHRADIYAAGAILYELLAGAKPHPGDSYNAILFDILNRPPTPLASVRAGLPAGLVEVVERALAFEPASRYATAAELADALAPYAGSEPSAHDAPASGAPAADARAFTMPTPETGRVAAARADDDGDVGGGGRGRARATADSSLELSARRGRAVLVAAMLVISAVGSVSAWRAKRAKPRRPAEAATVTAAAQPRESAPPRQPPPPPAAPAPEPARAAVAAPEPRALDADRQAVAPAASRRVRRAATPSKRGAAATRPGSTVPDIDIDSANPYDSK